MKSGGDYDYNFIVDWGDGHKSKVTNDNLKVTNDNFMKSRYHIYKKRGSYTVTITGKIEGLGFGDLSLDPTISSVDNYLQKNLSVTIKQWGSASFGEDGSCVFANVENVTIDADDRPDLSKTETLERCFNDSGIVFQKSINHWDTSKVKNMRCTFAFFHRFNEAIGNWEIGNIADMQGMFIYCDDYKLIPKWYTRWHAEEKRLKKLRKKSIVQRDADGHRVVEDVNWQEWNKPTRDHLSKKKGCGKP